MISTVVAYETYHLVHREKGNEMDGRVGLSRHDRKFAILRGLARDAADGNPLQWFTLGEIAKGERLKPTNHLRQILAELAAGKHILVRKGEAPNHEVRFEYRLNDEAAISSEFADEWAAYFSDFGA